MENIDTIFRAMDKCARDELKRCVIEYKKSGDRDAKAKVLKILKDYNDIEAIRVFLKEL